MIPGMKFNLFTSLFLVAAFALLGRRWVHGPWPPLRIAGGLLALVSLLLLLVARYQLGDAFSVRARASRLVTAGLYRRLRNPIYVFGCGLILGLALLVPFWPLALSLLVIGPMQVLRSRREAAVLEDAFGEEYRRYRRMTWF